MGRIDVPYGVKGWVNVVPFTAAPETLLDYRSWWLGRFDDDGRRAAPRERDVLAARRQGNRLVAQFVGLTDREQALGLKGLEIAVPRSWLPAPDDGEYYWADLVGLDVVNKAGVELGRCVGFMSHGGHDVLRVQGNEALERLIPYVDRYVLGVDTAAHCIRVDWELDW